MECLITLKPYQVKKLWYTETTILTWSYPRSVSCFEVHLTTLGVREAGTQTYVFECPNILYDAFVTLLSQHK